MHIFGFASWDEDKIILEHDGSTFIASLSALRDPSQKIIGAYNTGLARFPYCVYRKSLYGNYIIDALEDSRKFNLSGERFPRTNS